MLAKSAPPWLLKTGARRAIEFSATWHSLGCSRLAGEGPERLSPKPYRSSKLRKWFHGFGLFVESGFEKDWTRRLQDLGI